MHLGGGGGELFVNKADGLVVAVKGADGFSRELGGVELIALNSRSGYIVAVAFLEVGLGSLLDGGAAAVNILDGQVAVRDRIVAVGKGDGGVGAGGNGAAGGAGGADESAAEQDRAVGKCAVGAAYAVLRVLRLDHIAALGHVIDGEGAKALVNGLVAKAVDQNDGALAGNGNRAAVEVGDTLDVSARLGDGAAGYGVGNDLPARSAETGDGVGGGAVVVENANLVPLTGGVVGVGVGDHVTHLRSKGRGHKGVAVDSGHVAAHCHHGLVPLGQVLHGVGA